MTNNIAYLRVDTILFFSYYYVGHTCSTPNDFEKSVELILLIRIKKFIRLCVFVENHFLLTLSIYILKNSYTI